MDSIKGTFRDSSRKSKDLGISHGGNRGRLSASLCRSGVALLVLGGQHVVNNYPNRSQSSGAPSLAHPPKLAVMKGSWEDK